MKVPDLRKERLYAEVAKIHGKNESSIHEMVNEKKETHSSCALVPQTEKVRPWCGTGA